MKQKLQSQSSKHPTEYSSFHHHSFINLILPLNRKRPSSTSFLRIKLRQSFVSIDCVSQSGKELNLERVKKKRNLRGVAIWSTSPITRVSRLFHRGGREEGEEGWAERVFRISFPGIGGETASPSSRETANNYASVRRCGADARARDQRRPGQCACGLIATLPYQRVNSHCRETSFMPPLLNESGVTVEDLAPSGSGCPVDGSNK